MTTIAATSTRTPTLGDVWMSRDRRDQGRTIKVVGISETSVIVRSVSVRRVRMDVFIAGYRFVRHGTLSRGEEVAVVSHGGNPYGVAKDQRWRPNSDRDDRTIIVVEVDEDEGFASVRNEGTGRTTRCRLSAFNTTAKGYTRLTEENTTS